MFVSVPGGTNSATEAPEFVAGRASGHDRLTQYVVLGRVSGHDGCAYLKTESFGDTDVL